MILIEVLIGDIPITITHFYQYRSISTIIGQGDKQGVLEKDESCISG